MQMHAKFDQNIPCGSRVMNIFTNCSRTDGQTQIVIRVQTQWSCNYILNRLDGSQQTLVYQNKVALHAVG